MIIYEATKGQFIKDADEDLLPTILENTIAEKMHRKTPKNEFRSWENSLNYMYKALNNENIPEDCGIAIEYNIPQTSKRVDFMISGYGEKGQKEVVVIELKQWEKIEKTSSQDGLVKTFVAGANRLVVHPSYQAWSYMKMIEDYNENVERDQVDIAPCAYLHNYIRKDEDPLDAKIYDIYLKHAPAYTRGQVKLLRKYITNRIASGDQGKVLYEIDRGRIRPSKSLQNCINSMVKGNQEFVLLDDQKVVYEEILRLSLASQEDAQKRVVIVEGGPGTGKSVVAINLLADLTNRDQFVQYVSKNSAPRNNYKKRLKQDMKLSSIDNMFKGSGSYIDVARNTIDTLLVDEAHRLNAKSGLYGNQGENQIKEIIHASKCAVFFLDESQRVTLKDIGSAKEIEKWADEEHCEITWLKLESQFRCNGSNGYLAFLDHVLEIRETANYNMDDIDYDLRILDDPQDVMDLVLAHNHDQIHARLLAGYCWEWPKAHRSDTKFHDITIGDWGISWNLDDSDTYATDEKSVYEAGCIHTTQGLEFDYVGVIIGPDMRYENGHIVTDYNKRARTDQSLKGIKKMAKEDPDKAQKIADEIIKNTYRTLMTRGMKGCFVYCVDSSLNAYLKECLGRTKEGNK